MIVALMISSIARISAVSPSTGWCSPALGGLIQAELQRENVPGGAVAVVALDRAPCEYFFGYADVENRVPVTRHTIFPVGSVGKSFVALTFGHLASLRAVSLGARLIDLAPDLPIRNAYAGYPITLDEVLEHTAGFDDMNLSGIYNDRDPPDPPLREVIDKFKEPYVVRWRPGTRMSYSNPGYTLAGYVLERVSRMPYEEAVKRNVLDPLGMTESGFSLPASSLPLQAKSYLSSTGRQNPTREPYNRPAGDFKTTLPDMERFVAMLLRGGSYDGKQIVSRALLELMERPHSTDAARAGLKDGVGTGIDSATDRTLRYGHGGEVDSFVSVYRYIPDQGIAYVILLNGDGDYGDGGDVEATLLAHIAKPTNSKLPVRVGIPRLESYVGYYEVRNPRLQFGAFIDTLTDGRYVYRDGSDLYRASLTLGATRLTPESETLFRTESSSVANVVFISKPSGEMVMAGPQSYYVRVSPVWPAMRLLVILLSLMLMASAVVVVPVRLIVHRLRKSAAHWSRSLVVLVPIAVFGVFAWSYSELRSSLDPFSAAASIMYLSGLALPAAAIVCLANGALKWGNPGSRNLSWYDLAVGVAASCIAGYLMINGVVGFAPWEQL